MIGGRELLFPELPPPEQVGKLRTWKVGEAGTISGGSILQVLGERDMLLTSLNGGDRHGGMDDLVVRFKGWPTTGLYDGQQWTPKGEMGPLLLVGTYQYITAAGAPRTVLLAMPCALVRPGLTTAQYRALSE